MYKIAEHNPHEVLVSINTEETIFTKHCDKNATCQNGFNWTFDCKLELYRRDGNNEITATKEDVYHRETEVSPDPNLTDSERLARLELLVLKDNEVI